MYPNMKGGASLAPRPRRSYEPATNKPRLQDHKEWTGRRHLYGARAGPRPPLRLPTLAAHVFLSLPAHYCSLHSLLLRHPPNQTKLARGAALPRLPLPPSCPPAAGFTGHKAVTRMSTILTGMLIGLTAVAIQASIERLELLRNALLQGLFLADVRQAVGAWAGISIGFVLTSGTLVQLFAPKAAGAGVTLVMAFLNGALGAGDGGCRGGVLGGPASCRSVGQALWRGRIGGGRAHMGLLAASRCQHFSLLQQLRTPACPCIAGRCAGVDIRGLLSVPVFVLKVVGLVCSRMAGLAVGPEGPMVSAVCPDFAVAGEACHFGAAAVRMRLAV